MRTVYLLMGVNGSGKSTFANNLAEKNNAKILSSDDIKNEYIVLGSILKHCDSQFDDTVLEELHKRVQKELQAGNDIIVDSTNISYALRLPIINIAKSFKTKVVGILLELSDKEHKLDDKPTLDDGFHEIQYYVDYKLVDKEYRIMIATKNIGKISVYADVLSELKLHYCSLLDIDVKVDIEENGISEIENALIKARAYNKATHLPVLSNDSGLYIDKLNKNDQPGLFVRRNKGKELTDQEMIDTYIRLLNSVGGESKGHYNVGIAIIDADGKEHTQLFSPERFFISKPSKIIKEGVPLSSLAYDKNSHKYLSEMSPREKNIYEGKQMLLQAQFIADVFKQK